MRRFYVRIELILERVTPTADFTDEFFVFGRGVHSCHMRSQMIGCFEGNTTEITGEWAAGVIMPLPQMIVKFSLSIEAVTTMSAAKQTVMHFRVRHGIFNFYFALKTHFFDAFDDMIVFGRHVFRS